LLLAGSATLFPRIGRIRFNRLATIALIFVAAPFVVSTLRNSVYWTVRMLKANVELRHSLYPETERASIVPGLRSLPRLTDSRKLSAGLQQSENYNAVQGLLSLSRTPLAIKRRTAVFVPQSETKYWTILKRPNACPFGGFVVPSLTGMSMVDGMPAADCKLSPYYGLSLFQRRTREQRPEDTTPDAVCKRAEGLGFQEVLELHFDSAGRMTTVPLRCAAT